MFSTPTVFVLGAGASWHYGYPTGETLVKKVIEKAEIAAGFSKWSAENGNGNVPNFPIGAIASTQDWKRWWMTLHGQCEKLSRGLQQVNPLVIDYYLGWNSDLQEIGRILIAWVILECEAQSKDVNINREAIKGIRKLLSESRDDWCRFIIHQIAIHCQKSSDLHKNKVSFVTFNYDVSLEVALTTGLRHIQLFDSADVDQFMSGSRIVHMYGKVRELKSGRVNVNWQNIDATESNRMDFCNLLNVVYSASKGIRVIDPHDKGANPDDLTIARTQIHGAGRVFILGYGFDEHNSERLGLRESLGYSNAGHKQVAFTNFEDINQVNKRASKLLFGNTASFPPNGQSIAFHAEKSTRNTYDALSLDFDIA
ncbi:MAG TPA: hypothetical protein VK804_27015 [Bradyrhizobium sp.]|jgi:hypothetical protein|uniref:hypothetical protein n=1 Tax=Bradyrhizobium sp. TaxID=376 RepID=UPI002B619792|nr:hypothetical protein [Bradyrhizobium sp.]HTB04134.1 hypothetical protein [Bradyrhizobium sp.]